MEYLGNYIGYQVFRNDEGFLEGFKATGRVIASFKTDEGVKTMKSDSKRIITNQTTTDGFIKYINGPKERKRIKDTPLKPDQLPSLFDKL